MFTGKEVDTESALQYFGARYLSNGTNRFISIDPFVLQSDKLQKLLSDPQSLNGYAYGRNNPIVLVDLDGNRWYEAVPNVFFSLPVIKQFDSYTHHNAAAASSISSSLVPVYGDWQDLKEAVTGRETFTGEKLSPGMRALSGGLALLPLIGGPLVRQGFKHPDDITEGFVELYHGSRHGAEQISKEGFKGKFWVTDSRSLAEAYKLGDTGAKDPGVIKILMPKDVWESLAGDSGEVMIKNLRQYGWNGSEFKILTEKGRDIINKFIDKLEY